MLVETLVHVVQPGEKNMLWDHIYKRRNIYINEAHVALVGEPIEKVWRELISETDHYFSGWEVEVVIAGACYQLIFTNYYLALESFRKFVSVCTKNNSATEIKVPALGESGTTATVARWMKQPGEAVAAAEPLVVLETDKVMICVIAPVAGTLGEIVVAAGGEAGVGAVLGLVEDGSAVVTPAPDDCEPPLFM
jgi:hypothetical protein